MFRDQVAEDAKPIVELHFQQAASFWQTIYESSDVYGLIHRQRRDLVLSFAGQLKLPRHAKALDIGCGAGSISIGLAAQGFSVHAIDPVPEMIAMTKRAAADSGLNVVAQTGDIDHLPFASQSFDLVLAIGVLPWLTSYSTALEQVRRVLRLGGFFVANIDNTLALHRLLDPGMNFLLRPAKKALVRVFGGSLRRGTSRVPATTSLPGHFRSLLKTYGFELRNHATFGFGPISFFGHYVLSQQASVALHKKAQALCERQAPVVRSLGAQYLVVAQKVSSCK